MFKGALYINNLNLKFMKLTTEDTIKKSDSQKKAFIEAKKEEEKSLTNIEKEAARQIVKKCCKDMYARLAKRIKNISLAEMINEILQGKECPWVNMADEKWDCSKTEGCVKGESSRCFCADFVNCPAINHYFKNQIVSKLLRKMYGKNEIVDEAVKEILFHKEKRTKKER